MNGHALLPVLIFALPALSGCALVTKSDMVVPHYYSPELPLSPTTQRTALHPLSPPTQAELPSAHPQELGLRVGRIAVADHLRERIVYRESPGELAYYDDRRWAESPEAYVRRALSRALFEERGIRHIVSGAAPALELEVLAFEEQRQPVALARVAVTAVLHDQKTVHLEQTFVGEVRFDPADDGALSRAMTEAIQKVVAEVAEGSIKALRAMARPATPAPCADTTALPPKSARPD